MQTQVYALIKKNSKYHGQYCGEDPFPVEFRQDGLTGLHVVQGNANRYQIRDVNFYVRIADRFVKLK
jgi:hypothetical protein